MKWYKTDQPHIDEHVMCTVQEFNPDTGFKVTLNEYNDKEGLLTLKELHKKKIKKSIASFLRIGQQLVLCVQEVEGIYITLSKKCVDEETSKAVTEYYSITEKLFNLSKRLSHMSEYSEDTWVELFTDLMDEYLEEYDKTDDIAEHPYTLMSDRFRINELNLDARYAKVLTARHADLFGVQPVNKTMEFTVMSYSVDGNTAVKQAMCAVHKPYKTEKKWSDTELYEDPERCNVTVLPIALPKFQVHIQCYGPEQAQTVSGKIKAALESSCFDYLKFHD